MEARVAKLEADLTAIKLDLAVIKANGASKSDIADLRSATKSDIADFRGATKSEIADLRSTMKSDIAELKISIADSQTKIIMWVAVAIFLAQLLPLVKDFIKPAPQTPAATAQSPK